MNNILPKCSQKKRYFLILKCAFHLLNLPYLATLTASLRPTDHVDIHLLTTHPLLLPLVLPLVLPFVLPLVLPLIHQREVGRLVLGHGEVEGAVGGRQVQLKDLVLLVLNENFALTELPGHGDKPEDCSDDKIDDTEEDDDHDCLYNHCAVDQK